MFVIDCCRSIIVASNLHVCTYVGWLQFGVCDQIMHVETLVHDVYCSLPVRFAFYL